MANIEIYTKATCPFCHRAKALLSSKGVTFKELPIEAKNYVNTIEDLTGLKIVMISVGPDKDQTILRKEIF